MTKRRYVRGASKIKVKNVNKKRMATARRLIFFGISQGIHCWSDTLFFSWLQNSEGGGDSDSGDSFADPCQFLPFPKTKIQLSASLRPLAKNLQKQKLLLGSMWRKSKQKNWNKAFKWAAVKRQRFFTKIWFFGGFLAAVEALLKCFE